MKVNFDKMPVNVNEELTQGSTFPVVVDTATSKPYIFFDKSNKPFLVHIELDFLKGVDLYILKYVSRIDIYVTVDVNLVCRENTKKLCQQFSERKYEESRDLCSSSLRFHTELLRYELGFSVGTFEVHEFDLTVCTNLLWEQLLEIVYCRPGLYGLSRL